MPKERASMEGNGGAHSPLDACDAVQRETPPAIPPSHPDIATFDSGQAAIDYAVSLPQNYTPGYAYPLIVWFHDDGLDEQDVRRWLPRMSPQNYLGVGLRAPLPVSTGVPGQVRWSTGTEHVQWLENDLAIALQDVCERLSIHPERIVTAGIGRGGTMALLMLLRRPEWFAGSLALNAVLPPDWRLDWWGQYGGRRLWLGHSTLLGGPVGPSALGAARIFHAAGIDVTRRIYSPDEWPLETFGREIDEWLMHTLCGDSVVT